MLTWIARRPLAAIEQTFERAFHHNANYMRKETRFTASVRHSPVTRYSATLRESAA